jgi:hypothetical protein
MIEITLFDSNFPHQNFLTPYMDSTRIRWKRDGIRRKINVYTDNFIKSQVIDIPKDENKNICLLLEPYTNPPWTDIYDYIRTDYEKFDLIITHNHDQLGDLILQYPDKFHYNTKCITTSWLSEEMMGLHPKTKMISMPFSFKNHSEGHRIRHMIYQKYKENNVIDFFGSGIENYSGEFRECFMDYKYVIICENTLQKGFNSEKFNDAILTGCIPIYWGSRPLDSNIDSKSIFLFSPDKTKIDFDFDESLKNLEKIIDYVYKEDPYNSLIQSIENNFHYLLPQKQSEDNIFDILQDKGFIDDQIIEVEPKKKNLTEIALKYGVDKAWYHNYTDFYQKYFENLKNPKIIEIGTAGHGSTRMFLEYFDDCYLVGMDIVNYSDFVANNFKFVHGDQNKIEDLEKLISDVKEYDIILDDGSHTMKQQIAFGFLLPYLKNGGIYILEDLHTSFNRSYIESDCQFTTYEMLERIEKKLIPFSNYIDLEIQNKILESVESVEIFAKNPNNLSDSVTGVVKISKSW